VIVVTSDITRQVTGCNALTSACERGRHTTRLSVKSRTQ